MGISENVLWKKPLNIQINEEQKKILWDYLNQVVISKYVNVVKISRKEFNVKFTFGSEIGSFKIRKLTGETFSNKFTQNYECVSTEVIYDITQSMINNNHYINNDDILSNLKPLFREIKLNLVLND